MLLYDIVLHQLMRDDRGCLAFVGFPLEPTKKAKEVGKLMEKRGSNRWDKLQIAKSENGTL